MSQKKTKIVYLVLIATILSISFITSPSVLVHASQQAEIKVDILNVRSEPNLSSKVIGKVYQGEKYSILEEKNKWLKIQINDSYGWIAGWFVNRLNIESNLTKTAESTVPTLNVRNGPSTSFAVIDQIHPETKYPIVEQEGDWVKIQLNPNKTGWTAKWFLNITESKPSNQTLEADYVTIQVTALNVRKGPSTEFPIIGIVNNGDKVEVVEINDGWYKIKYKDDFGWIGSKYAEKVNETSSEQVQDPEQPKPPTSNVQKKVIVQADILNLRNGPSTNHEIVGKLYEKDLLIVESSDGEWFKVVKDNQTDVTGWVANWLVADYNEVVSNQPTVTILNPGTNLRQGPSTSYPVISIANDGDQFPILTTEGDWYQIQLPNGQKGYVAGWIVAVKGLEQNIERGIEKLLKNKVIVVDAGHGGRDHGATGLHFKSVEKLLNLSVANRLQKKLEAAGAKVVMTRTSDIKISLQGRVDAAILNRADAFISVHHNTNSNTIISGTITYYYNKRGKELADFVQNEVVKNARTENLNSRFGDYFVLRENPQLSILVELAFISNYQDELKARSQSFQENAAEGIFQGVLKYFNTR